MANDFIRKLTRDDRSRLVRIIRDSFPDAKRDEGAITVIAAALWSLVRQGEQNLVHRDLYELDLTPYARELDAYLRTHQNPPRHGLRSRYPDARYYDVEAEHSRKPPLRGLPDPFVGKLAMVRVTLPEDRARTFHTPIGSVEPRDHLISTLAEVREKVPTGINVARADLITPPRKGARFGAISVLLIYTSATATIPDHYILEAGTAMGEAKVLYWGERFDEIITRYCGYHPTPFSNKDNRYVGSLKMKEDSPDHLRVQVSPIVAPDTFDPHYLEINVTFTEKPQSQISAIWPGLLTAQAAVLVLTRQDAITRRNAHIRPQ